MRQKLPFPMPNRTDLPITAILRTNKVDAALPHLTMPEIKKPSYLSTQTKYQKSGQ